MTRLARLYLLFLIASLTLVGGGELVPRPYRRLARYDLSRSMRMARSEWLAAEVSLRSNPDSQDGLERQHRTDSRQAGITRELLVRDAQTALVLLLVLVSGLFALITLPGVRRRNAPTGRRGAVEVMEDEELRVDRSEVSQHLARLHPSRAAALAYVQHGPDLACSYCLTPLPMPVLGRVGRRVLMKLPPEGAKDLGIAVGEGWWARPSEPPPCPKCGGTGSVAV